MNLIRAFYLISVVYLFDFYFMLRLRGISCLFIFIINCFKVGFVGIFQPFRDAIKLFTREQYFPLVSNYLIYLKQIKKYTNRSTQIT